MSHIENIQESITSIVFLHLDIFGNKYIYMMVYWTYIGELPLAQCINNQNNGRTSDYYSEFYTKI